MHDTQGISRVWAEIKSPCFGITDSSITEIDLAPADADADGTDYNGLLDGFTYAGAYEITIRAQDKTGNYNSDLSEMMVYKEDGLACTDPRPERRRDREPDRRDPRPPGPHRPGHPG